MNAVTDMQPSAYWAGEFDKVNEFSQPDHWMLAPPLLFVAWVAVWITGFSTAILVLPVRAGLVISIALLLGNSAGASWWIGGRVSGGFWVGFGMFVAIGVLVATTRSKAGVLTGNHVSDPERPCG